MVPQPPATQRVAEARKPENLALLFQEIFTVIERLRSDRQPITDAMGFRMQVREALKVAQQESMKRGYVADDINLAIFAVVAFLDESVLNLEHPAFVDWPRQPLQEELFRHHIAGEVFFQNLEKLLGRNDSQDLADLLEVYQLCMLLGFAGKHSLAGRGELKAIIATTAEKIQRIRRSSIEISPNWRIPSEAPRGPAVDPWMKRIVYGSSGAAVFAILLFILYKISLASGVSALRAFAGEKG